MGLRRSIVTMGFVGLILVSGCTKKEQPLKDIHKVAIIGLTYAKTIEDTKIQKNLTENVDAQVVVAPIDEDLREYFDEIVLEARRLIEDKGIVVKSAESFSANKTLATLVSAQNSGAFEKDQTLVYLPKHYALALYPHDPAMLSKLATELGVDALVTMRVAVIKKIPMVTMFGLETKRIGVQIEFILIDKNGQPMTQEPVLVRSLSKQKYLANSAILNPVGEFKITSANQEVLHQVQDKLFSEMKAQLNVK